MERTRSTFSGRIGFVLAAAGSAVGLGNLWRFPSLAAKYGGGIFLLVYIILAVTFGFALMIAEIAIGRKTGLSAIAAYKALDKRFSFVGVLTSLIPAIILPYYCVIGGWVIKYGFTYISGNADAAAENTFFSSFVKNGSSFQSIYAPVFWFALFTAVTFIVVLLGVKNGVEAASKIMMPILVVLSVIIAIYVGTRPGALEGILYYIKPDFSRFSFKTVLAALGQLFYSMSLAMGIMITYGSYMKKNVSIEKAVHQIELFDTGIAFIAGFMIVPAVFIFSGPENLDAGPSLMFVTLPKVFTSMRGGAFIGAVFFILVFFAALTSSISLMETLVSIVQDKTQLKRLPCCLIVFAATAAIGLLSVFGYNAWSSIKILGLQLLDFFDFISNSVLMPIVSFLTCIFITFFISTKTITDEVRINGKFRMSWLFNSMITVIAPICIIAILATSLLDFFGVLKL